MCSRDAAKGHRLYPALVLAAHTGMRRGEVLALRWKDVDLDRRTPEGVNSPTVTVRASLQRTSEGLVLMQPKTAQSVREVALAPMTVAVLRAHKAAQAERRLALGTAWEASGAVFDRGDGQFVDPADLSVAAKQAGRRAGVDLHLHTLRHAFASALLREQVHPKVVADSLGHARITTTLQTYSHLLPGMGSLAAVAIERAYAAAMEGAQT